MVPSPAAAGLTAGLQRPCSRRTIRQCNAGACPQPTTHDSVGAMRESPWAGQRRSHAGYSVIPAAVWTYKLGGNQVLKKGLSYRERAILRRPLKPDEVQHFAETARRIAAVLLETHRNM